jgi:uncharacterized phosphosugar-binding protein
MADVVIDTGVPRGDAAIGIDGFEHPVGSTSTSIAIAIGHAINAVTAEIMVQRGIEPMVMVSPNTTEKTKAPLQNDKNYADLWRRLKTR